MNHTKAIALGLSLVALTACSFSFATDTEGAKKKYAENGYTVKSMSVEEYDDSEAGDVVTSSISMDEVIYVSKPAEKQYLYAFVFYNLDQAESWYNFESGFLKNLASTVGESDISFSSGQVNNVVWTGTSDAAKLVGWKLF